MSKQELERKLGELTCQIVKLQNTVRRYSQDLDVLNKQAMEIVAQIEQCPTN